MRGCQVSPCHKHSATGKLFPAYRRPGTYHDPSVPVVRRSSSLHSDFTTSGPYLPCTLLDGIATPRYTFDADPDKQLVVVFLSHLSEQLYSIDISHVQLFVLVHSGIDRPVDAGNVPRGGPKRRTAHDTDSYLDDLVFGSHSRQRTSGVRPRRAGTFNPVRLASISDTAFVG